MIKEVILPVVIVVLCFMVPFLMDRFGRPRCPQCQHRMAAHPAQEAGFDKWWCECCTFAEQTGCNHK